MELSRKKKLVDPKTSLKTSTKELRKMISCEMKYLGGIACVKVCLFI